MKERGNLCDLTYVGGYRRGQPCPYRASALVDLSYSPKPFRVCGYHARAYGDGVVYPLDWSLETVMSVRWRLSDLERLPK